MPGILFFLLFFSFLFRNGIDSAGEKRVTPHKSGNRQQTALNNSESLNRRNRILRTGGIISAPRRKKGRDFFLIKPDCFNNGFFHPIAPACAKISSIISCISVLLRYLVLLLATKIISYEPFISGSTPRQAALIILLQRFLSTAHPIFLLTVIPIRQIPAPLFFK